MDPAESRAIDLERWYYIRISALEKMDQYEAAGVQMPAAVALAEAMSFFFHGESPPDSEPVIALDRAGRLRKLAAILEDPDGDSGAVSAPESPRESSADQLTGGEAAIQVFQQRAAAGLARLNAALDPLGLEEFNTHETQEG